MSYTAHIFGTRYRADRLLKTGQGVDTYLGTDLARGQAVVIKTAEADSLSPGARLRLEHEARVLKEVRSPWLVPLLHLGAEAGVLYLVMPYLAGMTLEHRLRSGPLPLREALTVGYCLFAALQEAHDQGVLHRDVKPANVMVREESPLQGAMLIDFGLARSLWLAPTLRDQPVGSIRYMAPELAGGIKDEVAEYSDLYAAGLVLFECLAGHPPFRGNDVGEVLRQHLTAPVPDLRQLGVAVPTVVNDILQRLLRKDPRDRYQSAAAVVADLAELTDALARGVADPLIVVGAHDRRRTLAEPAFIGRGNELAALGDRLQRTCSGAGGLVLVEAESGGGKTRLLGELKRIAEHQRLWVLMGQGVDQAAQRPFQVLDGVVTEFVARARADPRWLEGFGARLGDQGGAVAAALPQVASILRPDPSHSLGPEAFGETRTIDALGRLLDELGTEERPALVLLDDCQWADELTVRLLIHWQRRRPATSQPARYVLVVAAFRGEEVPAHHPLRTLPPEQRLLLEPLGVKDIQRLLESMAGPLPAEAVEVATRLSAGSPFMASAVMRGLVEIGALVPESSGWATDPQALAEARSSYRAAVFLARRLEQLPSDVIRLLTVGAVLGREFDLKFARSLAGQVAGQVATGLEAARQRQLVWIDAASGRCTFVHDKIREALLARLPDSERRRLHHEAALSLEALQPERIYELAYHFDAAGDPERAFPYALASAERARRQHALEIAEKQYRIAERGAGMCEPAVRFRLAEGLGDVLMLRGRYDEAQRQFELARTLAAEEISRAQVEGRIGELAFKRGDCQAASQALENALRLLGQSVPRRRPLVFLRLCQELASQTLHTLVPSWFVGRRPLQGADRDLLAVRLYSRLAYAYWFQKGTLHCLWAHLREMNLAERYPPTLELAQAYSEHAPALSLIPLYRRGIAYVERSLAIRKAMGDLWGQGQSLHFYGVILFASARFEEAIQKCREALRLLEQTGDRWEVNLARYHIAYSLYRQGDLAGAVKEARLVYQAGLDIGDAQAPAISLEILAKATGGRVPADAIQNELGRLKEDVQRTSNLLQAEGLRLLGEGRPDDAVAAMERAFDILTQTGMMNAYVAPALAWLVTALREATERTPLWDHRRRRALLHRARRTARRAVRLARKFPGDLPHAWREAGLLAAIRGRNELARRCLDKSLATAELQGARDEWARTLLAKGRIGLALGWPGAAAETVHAEQRLLALREGLHEGDRRAPSSSAHSLSLADRFDTVLEAGRAIAGALTAPAVVAAVRDAALKLLRGETCLFLDVTLSSSADGPIITCPHEAAGPYSRTLVERSLAAGLPLIVTEGLPDCPSESTVLTGVRSVLCAPVFVRGRPAACLYVSHRQLDRLFGDEERRLAQFITTLAGAALENAAGFAELTAAHEQLRFQKTLLECQGEASIDGILVLSPQGAILSRNRRLVELWELPDTALTAGAVEDLWGEIERRVAAPPGWAATAAALTARPEGTQQEEVLLTDGRTLDCYTAPVAHPDGTWYGRAWHFRDITARKRAEEALQLAHAQLEQRVAARTADLVESNARLQQEVEERRRVEEALRESEERYRTVAETAAEAIITMDERGRIVFVNRATEQIFGYTAAELLGRPLTVLMPDRYHTAHKTGLTHYLRTGQRRMAWECAHLPGRHKSGREIPLELAFWEFTQHGRRYFSSLIRDITDRLQAAELRTRLLERVISAQEEERRRLARELHDETGQALMALLVQLHEIERASTLAAARTAAERVRQIAAQTLDEVRRLAIGLRPNVLDDVGLVAAIERYVAEYTKSYGIQVDVHARGIEGRLPAPIELALYRIHQEALTNVAKHAGATLVSIVLERQPRCVQAIIEDDGCGFEVQATLDATGRNQQFGLHSMRERAALVHGSLAIESTPGRGTTVYVTIPLDQAPRDPADGAPCPTAPSTGLRPTGPAGD